MHFIPNGEHWHKLGVTSFIKAGITCLVKEFIVGKRRDKLNKIYFLLSKLNFRENLPKGKQNGYRTCCIGFYIFFIIYRNQYIKNPFEK